MQVRSRSTIVSIPHVRDERVSRPWLGAALFALGAGLIANSAAGPLLADVIREMGFRKASEFYIALGQGKISTKAVAKKLMQRLEAGEAVEKDEPIGRTEAEDERARRTKEASNYGIRVKGADKVAVQTMVAKLLGLREIPKPADAADALALACCHVWRAPLAARLTTAGTT